MAMLRASKTFHKRLAALLSVFFAAAVVLFVSITLATPLQAYASEEAASNANNAIISNVASAYSPKTVAGMTTALDNQIRTIMGEASYLSLYSFSSAYKDDEILYKHIKEPHWNYYGGGFGGIEKKTPYRDSAADYTAKQTGAYIMASRYLTNDWSAGALYAFQERNIEHSSVVSNEERQLFHSLGGFLGYRQEGWYLFNTLTYSAGFHSWSIESNPGETATADYNSQNIKNRFILGKIFDGLFRTIPEVSLVYDYISATGYTDSLSNQYAGFSKNILHGSLGVCIINNYKIMGTDIEPHIAVNFIKSIGSRDIQTYRQDGFTKEITTIIDRIEKDYFLVEAGINAAITSKIDLRFAYTGAITSASYNNFFYLSLLMRDWGTELSVGYNAGDNFHGLALGDSYDNGSVSLGVKIAF